MKHESDVPDNGFEEDKLNQKRDFINNKFINELTKINSLTSNSSVGCKKCNHSNLF